MIDQDACDCMNRIVTIKILIDRSVQHCIDRRFFSQCYLILNNDV